MTEKIPYYGGLRLNDLIKATTWNTTIKIISAKTGRTLLQNARKDKDGFYWGLEIFSTHIEMQTNRDKDYATAVLVCYTDEENFYKRKNGAQFEDEAEEKPC
jgi:hypothetical protein